MGSKNPFFKICIVGDFGVGKSSLLLHYLERRFISNVESTIASNFFLKQIKIPNVQNYITLQIWDLAGQDHFKWIRKAFYKGSSGLIYMFDLSRKETFDHIKLWKKEVESTIGIIPNILVGNKLDLINSENHPISLNEITSLKQKLKACAYCETSAKLGTGVDKIFYDLSIKMHKFHK